MIKTVNNCIQIIEWQEDITLKNVEQFRQEMGNLLKTNYEKLILSLANTAYINSAGLGVIADSVMQARRNDKELIVSDIQPSIKEIFVIVKFASFMKLFESEQEAIEYLLVN